MCSSAAASAYWARASIFCLAEPESDRWSQASETAGGVFPECVWRGVEGDSREREVVDRGRQSEREMGRKREKEREVGREGDRV